MLPLTLTALNRDSSTLPPLIVLIKDRQYKGEPPKPYPSLGHSKVTSRTDEGLLKEMYDAMRQPMKPQKKLGGGGGGRIIRCEPMGILLRATPLAKSDFEAQLQLLT